MSEQRLATLLRETEVPGSEAAERRGLAMVEAAFEERRPARRNPLPRLALSFAVVVVLGALLLSPAGAAVRDWIDDVFTAGVPHAEPELSDIPGGGRLLVGSAQGPWVVQPDGSRRLLGPYSDAAWSPRGLYVAVADGRTLSAVEPDGTPHWSISAPAPIGDPRWSPPRPWGVQIAYRAGSELRVVAGDGTEERMLDPEVARVAPSWNPFGLSLLAYVDSDETVRVIPTEGAEAVDDASARGLAEMFALEWGGTGTRLLEASPRTVRVRAVALGKLGGQIHLGAPLPVDLPPGRIRAAALSPDGGMVAVLLWTGAEDSASGRTGSEVYLASLEGGTPEPLFGVSGRLSELAWSPSGERLLIAWPDADQWLFVRAAGGGRVRAVDGISRAFAPNSAQPPFPSIEGWCCDAD